MQELNEFKFEANHSCEMSDIFYQRAKAAELIDLDGLENLNSANDRMRFVSSLRNGGPDLCERLGIKWVDTAGAHDVTFGQSPFGDFYFGDMLASLYDFRSGDSVLDFGCSTGRIIRNLKAAYPEITAFACDPRQTSIDVASKSTPEVTWFINSEVPPIVQELPLLDMVFAISVWSHFSEERALEWFAEMARLIIPGGKLIFTTHGLRSVFHFSKVKRSMPENRAEERWRALSEGQFHFMRYGESDLDHHWGVAFIPESWVHKKLSDSWKVERFAPGLAMANQDTYVLTRRRN